MADPAPPSLAAQYARQYAWRSWNDAYAALPPLAGARVLDLGCAIGDQSRDLAALGAQVYGVDGDGQLIAHALSRGIAGAEFHQGDIGAPEVEGHFDGIWASFVPAYFPDFFPVLSRWRELLRPGGWIALTEMEGLFAHTPLPQGARDLLAGFAREAREAGGYDFGMGGRLTGYLRAAGFEVKVERVLPDRELSFAGAAGADVLGAWAGRLARMHFLQERAKRDWPSLREDFLNCISSPQHTSDCRVQFCLATRS